MYDFNKIMYPSYLIYKITEKPVMFLLFRFPVVLSISIVNHQCSLCALNVLALDSLSDDEFITFFYNWINKLTDNLPDTGVAENDPLHNYFAPEAIQTFSQGLKVEFRSLISQQTQKLEQDEIYALKRYHQHISAYPTIDPVRLVHRKDSENELSVYQIIQNHLPKLNRGAFLKGYLDSMDYRIEVKQAMRYFVLSEEQAILNYFSEHLFRNLNATRVLSQKIGN